MSKSRLYAIRSSSVRFSFLFLICTITVRIRSRIISTAIKVNTATDCSCFGNIYLISVITKFSLCFLSAFPMHPEGNYSQFSRTSFNLFISSGFAICPFMPVFLANCTSSAKALAVMATIGSFPFSPGRLLIAAVAS